MTVSATETLEEFRDRQRVGIASTLVHLTARRGLAAANVSDLVREVGLSRKTFYKYFDSVDAVFVFAQEQILEEIGDIPARAEGTGLERFLRGLRNIADFAASQPEKMVFLSFFDFALKDFVVDQKNRADYDTFASERLGPPLSAFIDGQEDGSIRPELVARDITMAATNAVFGLAQRCLNAASGERTSTLTRLVELEIGSWEHSISASPR